MTIRRYRDYDEQRLRELHRLQGLDYELPNLARCGPSIVIEDGGLVRTALILRPTAEAFLLTEPGSSTGLRPPREELGRLLVMNKEAPAVARSAGLTDVYLNLPPQMARFEKILKRLGFVKQDWPQYVRQL